MKHPIHSKHPALKILLGSSSPRRKLLLKDLGLAFETCGADIDETFPSDLKEEEIPVYLAYEKAQAIQKRVDVNTLLITADTIVWHNHQALNKPQNEKEAIQMLSSLSNSTHIVYTGVCFLYQGSFKKVFCATEVLFRELREEEIVHYVRNYNPYDKAGAYGAQEWLGYIAIESINGSYFNVMGLPVHEIQLFFLEKFDLY